MIKLFFIGSFVLLASSTLTFRYVIDPEAQCLDGSRASYYFDAGSTNNYIIYFEGGGWIQGDTQAELFQQAYDRSFTTLGSSKDRPQTVSYDGIFKRDQNLNPEFYDWNYIYINYCDGTGHQGYRFEPYYVNDRPIYIRGDRIFRSIITEYEYSLFRANKVLLTGCSAGGLAVFSWAQYLKDRLPLSVNLMAAPDSGVFLDLPPFDSKLPASDRRQKQYTQIANVEQPPPNEYCVKAYPNEIWKCQFAEYLLDFIDVPIFFVQSWYDAACIPNILHIHCTGGVRLDNCSAEEKLFIENQHYDFKKLIDSRIEQDPRTGSFAPACLEHCFLHKDLYHSEKWEIPSGSGLRMNRALSQWVNDISSEYNNHQDLLEWPYNSGCAYH